MASTSRLDSESFIPGKQMRKWFGYILIATVLVFDNSVLAIVPFPGRTGRAIQQDTTGYVSPFRDQNERCFKCHGQSKYEYSNENLGLTVKALMCSERIVDRNQFYSSNHKSFSCTDCHSEGYAEFPHPGELRMEQKFNCLDCHGGDPAYEKYQFEEIDSEYRQSTHFKLEKEGFSCWKCHNPHYYKLNIRDNKNISEAVIYDNNLCLNCHANFKNFQLLTDAMEINIVREHNWLPNQSSHFKSVRCIECHAKANDTLLVAHLIKPKEEAVRGCNECHSKNSILMSSLYKHLSKEERKSNGFVNAVMLNQSYVIGANRNEYLNLISLIIFGMVLLAIAVHIIFRIKSSIKAKGGDNVSVS